MDDGELWSFFRRALAQGAAIEYDYRCQDIYQTYEHYSARLDEAARERVKQFREECADVDSMGTEHTVTVATHCAGCGSDFLTNLPRSCPKCQAQIDKLTRVLLGSEGLAEMRRALSERKLPCAACGADRYREPCRRPTATECAMVGVAFQTEARR